MAFIEIEKKTKEKIAAGQQGNNLQKHKNTI